MTKNTEKYFSCLLTLFLPWRTYGAIKQPHTSYEDAYYSKIMLIDHASLKFFPYQEQLVKAIQQIRALREESQQDTQCKITPTFMSINEEPDKIEEITNTLAYNDIQNVSEIKTKEKE